MARKPSRKSGTAATANGRAAKGAGKGSRTIASKGRPRNKARAEAIKNGVAPVTEALEPQQVSLMRELFWQNVIREILTSLSSVAALRPPELKRSAEMVKSAGSEHPPEHDAGAAIVSSSGTNVDDAADQYQPELFDGRMSVILQNGERIPIADVFPIFACSINTPTERPLAAAVECSVFQIRTPQGQVFTIPLHEIRAFHALSPELLKRIASSARRQQRRAEVPEEMPFGFAAYTSLSGPHPVPEAPQHPME